MIHWIIEESSIYSYRKEKSQRHLAMNVLESIPLEAAGFVQARQHLLDLLKSLSDVLVRSITHRSSRQKPQAEFIDRRQHYYCWTTGIQSRIPSSAGGRKEKPGPSISCLDTLLWCLCTYLLTIQLNAKWPPMKNMWPTQTRDPGRARPRKIKWNFAV